MLGPHAGALGELVAVSAVARPFAGVARERYDSSDETLYKPVSLTEVDRLLAAKGRPVAGKYPLQHFLYRVRTTLHAADEANRDLRRSVEAVSENKRRAGTPTTLSPIDAVKFASPEELASIVGTISSSQLTALQRHVDDARSVREELVANLDAVRAAVHAISARDDIPATVRAEFVDLVNTLPPSPAEVPVPKALELGRMAGLVEDSPTSASPELEPPSPSGPLALGAGPSGSSSTQRRDIIPATSSLAWYGPPPSWHAGPGLIRHDKEQP